MSEHITHLAICDDALRLAARHPGVEARFKEVTAAHHEASRLGAVTRSADRWAAHVVDWAREDAARPPGERDRDADQKLAFVLGSLTHRAADRLMKPLLDYAKQREGEEGFVEATVHCDVFCFKEIYGAGEGPLAGPFARAILDAPAGEAERRFEEYFHVLWRRQLVEMHTFAPDRDDVHGWLSRLFQAAQDFPMSMRRYARVAAEWEPAKVKRYLEDTHFYDRGDALIEAAREAQRAGDVAGEDVVAAAAGTDERSSRYARALAKSLDYLVAASALYGGAIDLAEGKRRLEVGVPELSLAIGRH
jgi:hypothetical protein